MFVCAVTQQVRPLWVRPQLISGRPLLVNIHNNNNKNNNNAKRGSEKNEVNVAAGGLAGLAALLLATNVAALCIWSIICINIDTTLFHIHTHTHLSTHPHTRVNVENDDALVVAALLLRLLLYL